MHYHTLFLSQFNYYNYGFTKIITVKVGTPFLNCLKVNKNLGTPVPNLLGSPHLGLSNGNIYRFINY